MSNEKPWSQFLAGAGYHIRRYAELEHRVSEWYAKQEPIIRRALQTAERALAAFPVTLALASVTFSRGGWSEAPLGEMDLGEWSELVVRLMDEPDEVVRRELDQAILEHFSRDSHAELSKMVTAWREQFGERHRIFEDALFAHKVGLYTLSIPALAAQVEGILRDLTREYGRKREWILRFNAAFGYEYEPRNPPPPPSLEEVMSEFQALSETERYRRAEELRQHYTLQRINELYDDGEFTDPEFSSSVNRHAILHGVFHSFGELESLRLFFILDLLHQAIHDYRQFLDS